jgi:hypothetical protein
VNNIRVVITADSTTPSTGWIRVNVAGTCGKTVAGSGTTTPPPPAPPVVSYKPGSAEWNNFNVAWGYSNYAVTQLKGKGYARYNELANLNSLITSAVNARSVNQSTYNSLMASWNSFVNEPAFRTALSAVVASNAGKK